MTPAELASEVARLLKRSDEADSQATEAKVAGDVLRCLKLRRMAEDLNEQAACVDPNFTAPAWKQ